MFCLILAVSESSRGNNLEAAVLPVTVKPASSTEILSPPQAPENNTENNLTIEITQAIVYGEGPQININMTGTLELMDRKSIYNLNMSVWLQRNEDSHFHYLKAFDGSNDKKNKW